MRITCTVNGEQQQADDVWEGESLLYVLRERLGFPGSKNACEQGECGSCTVYLDGVLACACLVAAGQAQGRDVRTVEGLATRRPNCPPCSGPSWRRARCSAASAPPGCWSPRTTCIERQPAPSRRRDPGGAGRQSVPVHRVREDHGRGPPGGGPAVWPLGE